MFHRRPPLVSAKRSPVPTEVDFFHRRPGKRHFIMALGILAACGLGGWRYATVDRQQAAVQGCVKRALASYRRVGLRPDARVGPGAGRPARDVAADLCGSNTEAF